VCSNRPRLIETVFIGLGRVVESYFLGVAKALLVCYSPGSL